MPKIHTRNFGGRASKKKSVVHRQKQDTPPIIGPLLRFASAFCVLTDGGEQKVVEYFLVFR